MKRRVLYLILFITPVISFSCKDYLTLEPKSGIPPDQTFKSANDAISAMYGLYSLMQPCVDQLFLAGDVQSDLVVAARGADQWISEIAQNRVSPMNPYTDYSNFYNLVVACNNTVKGLDDIERLDPVNYSLEKHTFNLAEIVCIRAWAYLQLVKIWGDVPYYENSVTDLNQVTDIAPSPGNVILATMNKEVSEQAYPILKNAFISDANYTILYGQFQHRSCPLLLHEINLYLGDYVKSAEWLRPFCPYGFDVYNYYRCQFGQAPNFIKQYAWGSGNEWRFEIIMGIPFDGSKRQKNNLMHWTSNVNGGIYAVKPSTIAIKNWASQYQTVLVSGTAVPVVDQDNVEVTAGLGDLRGSGVSYYVNNGDTLISKYLLKSGSLQTISGVRSVVGEMKDPVQKDAESNDDANFPVYRAGVSNLYCAECWNSMGLWNIAAFPINGVYDRYGSSPRGIRGRAQVQRYALDLYSGDLYNQIENIIIKETALEAAYEGIRWFSLVRSSKRNNDPSILANTVASKYPASQQAAIIARLSDRNRWYWPYYYKNVAANKLLGQKPGY